MSSLQYLIFLVLSLVAVVNSTPGFGDLLGHSPTCPSIPVPNPLPYIPLNNHSFVLNGLAGQPPQTRVFNFVLSLGNGAPDGIEREMVVVNGQYPGPIIEANQYDHIVVNVQNLLPNATTLHWHGLYQNGTNYYDGNAAITECAIPPGKSMTYSFDLGEFSGTTWWQMQYTDGVIGGIVVHPTARSPPGLPTWDEDVLVVMQDWYHQTAESLLVEYLSAAGPLGTGAGNEPVPDSATLNGHGQYFSAGSGGSYFTFNFVRGKTYRIRLVNAGSLADIRFSIDNHPLTVIEADGTLIEPTTVAGVSLAVAQRYSVIVHANATANTNGLYWMRSTLLTDMFTYTEPGQNIDIRGVIRYTGSHTPPGTLPNGIHSQDPGPGAALPDLALTTTLVPLMAQTPPPLNHQFTVSFEFDTLPDGSNRPFINNVSWVPLQGTSTLQQVMRNPGGYAPEGLSVAAGGQLIWTETSVQVVQVVVNNLDGGGHPFHLHGHSPWIIGSGPGTYVNQQFNPTNPMHRDTIFIPANSFVVLQFITNNPGLWAFHCHIAWHLMAGLLMQFNSLPFTSAHFNIPPAITTYCAADCPQ
ncbi:multicopper oxidase [Sphaerobolus stellatus SS14]|uniref:Multicopper oxidase n=1 Tax=Sphaerobolus stellatus (strain SS14) TaxID=990650 RepID=A0A0C9VI59_SPHS4|nr:multicopper oxidase [Sphaerobolus stellatus SS14]